MNLFDLDYATKTKLYEENLPNDYCTNNYTCC